MRYDPWVSRRRPIETDDVGGDVPRLPRGKGLSLTGPAMFKVLVTAALLVMVIVLQKPCANAAGKMFSNFDPPDAAPDEKAIPTPDQLDVPGSSGVYIPIGEMTPDEVKAAVEKGRKEAAEKAAAEKAGSGSGSGGGGGSGSGSGSGSATP